MSTTEIAWTFIAICAVILTIIAVFWAFGAIPA